MALAIYQKSLHAQCYKSLALLIHGKYQESLLCAEKALTIDQNSVNALVFKSCNLIFLKKLEESIKFADMALAINPILNWAFINKCAA